VGAFSQQLKQVFRRLGQAPLFTAITLITLAAGIGGNTVVFSVLEGVLLKPLPYPRAEELVGVWHTAPGFNIADLNMSPSNYFIYREQGQTLQDIGLYQGDSASVTGIAEPEQVHVMRVSDATLPLLGISPLLGRTFSKEDDQPKAAKTVVLTYGYWRHKFGGDPSAIGKTLIIDGESHQIIGVMPQRFRFLDEDDLQLFLTFQFDRSKVLLGNFSYEAFGRLKPGATLEQLNADVARMLPIVRNTFSPPPGFSLKLFDDAHIGPNVRSLKRDVVGDVGSVLWVLMGSIGMVLLIACANVANLLLVRVEGRRQELALRSALGASWGRIAAELWLESLSLGFISCLLGLGLAWGALRILRVLAPESLPRIHDVGIDGPVLLFTAAIAMLTSLLFGAIPVFKYAGSQLSTGIREGGRALSQSREQHRARSVLVVLQVSLALVLLICSGLMIRTFRAMTKVDPGFTHAAELQTFRFSIPEAQVKNAEPVIRMEEDILHKVETIPGVSSVAITTAIPMANSGWHDPIFVEGRTYAEGELPPLRAFKFVSPGLLNTLDIRLVAGRDFTWAETYKKLPVAMISENIAREYWHDPAAALGKRIRVSTKDDWREIVGVVGNVYYDGVSKPATTACYWPLLLDNFESDTTRAMRDVSVTLRTSRAGSESLMTEVRQAVWSVNPNLPLANVHTLDYFYKRSMARTSFTLVMLGVAGAMALLLGVVGIYGVIAYSVSQRRREIGIRMALGAQQPTLTGMFVRYGLFLTGIGVACGLVVAILIMRLMSTLLFQVNPTDPLTYVAVSVGLIFTAFLASYLPSRRAATVDPVEALRAE